MIFAIAEDGGLLVFEDEAELRRDLEEIDVVGSVYSIFAEDGSALAVMQDPSEAREGWRRFVFGPNTAYTLKEATGAESHVDLFASRSDVSYLEENPYFKTVDEVMSFARSRRATSV
jgi:hypothetical protein